MTDVERYLSKGHFYLQQGLLDHARKAYESAFSSSIKLKKPQLERSCAFNLGAVYIALNEVQKGLKWLEKAVPPVDERNGTANGDVFYNLGLAYELLSNFTEAVKYYELAYQEYHSYSKELSMELTVAKKVALLYKRLKNPLQAVKFYKVAASLLQEGDNIAEKALCLSQMAAQLVQCFKYQDAQEAADQALELCYSLKHDPHQGRLYNELGLIFTQCHNFPNAAHCFEQAVAIFHGSLNGSKEEAVVLQNLGAVYNSLGVYDKALKLHESAASLHANSNNRGLQGQCFTNLAFAYSQLNDVDTAGECYMHAVQAAKDAKDKKGQWQAMEGLGTVCFNQGKTDKAVVYFKLALRILMDCNNHTPQAEERLLGKITDALHQHVHGKNIPEFQTISNVLPQSPVQTAELLTPRVAHTVVESANKPPQSEAIIKKSEAMVQDRSTRKVARKFDGVAHGIGRYNTEDDLSIAGSIRSKIDEEEDQSKPDESQANDSVDLEHLKRRNKGLLRSQTHNSELEWQKEVKESVIKERSFGAHCIPIGGHSGDEKLQFVEKLGPIVSDAESEESGQVSNDLPNQQKIKQILKREVIAKDQQYIDEDMSDTKFSQNDLASIEDGQSEKHFMESNNSSDEELSTNDHLKQYQHRIRRKSMHDEASTVVSSNDETERESSANSVETEKDRPALPLQSPPHTQVLSNTYEEPLPVHQVSSDTAEEDGENKGLYGANYFRPDPQSSHHSKLSSPGELVEDENPYQTIRSVKKTSDEDVEIENSSEASEEEKSPELPPRMHRQNLTRGQEEEYLRKVHTELRNEKPNKDDLHLPSKNNRKSKSQMCLMM